MDERARRVGLNEALFREVNQRVEGLARDFGVEDQPLELLCECGNAACVQRIGMSTLAYRELRLSSTRFAVVPGHEASEVERVIERRAGYDVIEKDPGEPARLAVETDPRG